MATEKELTRAKFIFDSLRDALDKIEWRYRVEEESLKLVYAVNGDDVNMEFTMSCDVERQLIRLYSVLPFRFPEEKRAEGAIATCEANYKLAHGSFDFHLNDGMVVFRLVNSYRDSLVGAELFEYMVSIAASTVDRYNDLFMMLGKGMFTLQDYIDKINE